MTRLIRKIRHSTVTYPISISWVFGVTCMCLYAAGIFELATAIVVFGVSCMLIVLAVVRNDVAVVHELVNSQRTALVEKIDALTAVIIAAGLEIPPDPELPKTAKAEEEVHGT